MKIRVVLCDDHDVVRDGLRAVLEASGDIEVVGEVANGREAVATVEALKPNVVVMDLAMPLLNGVEATRQITQATPKTKVLVLSSYSEGSQIQDLIRVGVAGYLLKESAASELVRAIHGIHAGQAYFSPSIAKQLLPQARQQDEVRLTPREAEVWQLVAEGYANKQVADVLSISVKTVEKHRQFLMEKLKLHSTADLTREAVKRGVTENHRLLPHFPVKTNSAQAV